MFDCSFTKLWMLIITESSISKTIIMNLVKVKMMKEKIIHQREWFVKNLYLVVLCLFFVLLFFNLFVCLFVCLFLASKKIIAFLEYY